MPSKSTTVIASRVPAAVARAIEAEARDTGETMSAIVARKLCEVIGKEDSGKTPSL